MNNFTTQQHTLYQDSTYFRGSVDYLLDLMDIVDGEAPTEVLDRIRQVALAEYEERALQIKARSEQMLQAIQGMSAERLSEVE